MHTHKGSGKSEAKLWTSKYSNLKARLPLHRTRPLAHRLTWAPQPASRGQHPWPAAWPKPGRSLTAAWPQPGRCLAVAWPQSGRSLAAASPLLGGSLAAAWPQPGRSVATAWPQPGRSLAAAWPQTGRSLAAAWPMPGRCLAAVCPQPGRCLAAAWPQTARSPASNTGWKRRASKPRRRQLLAKKTKETPGGPKTPQGAPRSPERLQKIPRWPSKPHEEDPPTVLTLPSVWAQPQASKLLQNQGLVCRSRVLPDEPPGGP